MAEEKKEVSDRLPTYAEHIRIGPDSAAQREAQDTKTKRMVDEEWREWLRTKLQGYRQMDVYSLREVLRQLEEACEE